MRAQIEATGKPDPTDAALVEFASQAKSAWYPRGNEAIVTFNRAALARILILANEQRVRMMRVFAAHLIKEIDRIMERLH